MSMADSLYCLRLQSNGGGRTSKQNSLSIQSGMHHIGNCQQRASPIPLTSRPPSVSANTTIPAANNVWKLKRQESSFTQEEIYRYVQWLKCKHSFCKSGFLQNEAIIFTTIEIWSLKINQMNSWLWPKPKIIHDLSFIYAIIEETFFTWRTSKEKKNRIYGILSPE